MFFNCIILKLFLIKEKGIIPLHIIVYYLQIGSSHQPKAILPLAASSGDSGFDKNIKKEPPGGKMNFPCSSLTRVVSG